MLEEMKPHNKSNNIVPLAPLAAKLRQLLWFQLTQDKNPEDA